MTVNEKKTMTDIPPRVLISGGGTGGHIFPALSIANEVRRRYPDAEILFVGAQNRMEMDRVPAAGYRIVGLPVMGFDRKKLWRNVKVLFNLWKSMRMARRIVREFRPDIAVGVGGYASGPTIKAAQRAGIPSVIQEQNSYAGVTNKMLASDAHAICVAYDNMDRFFPADKIIKTGNPVRTSILDSSLSQTDAKSRLGFDTSKPLVLVIGGSLGSLTINRAIAAAIDSITEAGASILWQTGKFYSEEYAPLAKNRPNVRATPFIDDMPAAYRAADIVVSRAGASTISELQLIGATAILVPSPNVAEDHQRKNAMALVDADAAEMILDCDAVENLGIKVTSLLNDVRRRMSMSENIAKMALPDAAKNIVDCIDKLRLH